MGFKDQILLFIRKKKKIERGFKLRFTNVEKTIFWYLLKNKSDGGNEEGSPNKGRWQLKGMGPIS